MIFRDTTWKGAQIQPGSRWRNSVALYQVSQGGSYHKTSRRFLFTGRMSCGVKYEGRPADYVRVSRDDLGSWSVCEDCAARTGF
jgi:hypothetical protein